MLMHALAVVSLISLAIFFVFLRWPGAGSALSGIVVVLGLVSLVPNALSLSKDRKGFYSFLLIPVALWLSVAIFYSLFFASCRVRLVDPVHHYYNYCVTKTLPVDNVLPQYFGNNIMAGHPEKKFSSWNMYDRPPLQSAIVMTAVSPFGNRQIDDYSYYFIAVLLQTAWVPLLWLMLPALAALKGRQRYFVMCSMIFSGFFFVNSIFTWPKMLAGIFVVGSYYYLFCIKRSRRRSLYAGALAGLGFMSHGGAVFTVPAILLVYLLRGPAKKWTSRLTDILLYLAVFLAVYAPWAAYKAVTATTGDRLIKLQLGGVNAVDSRGTVQTLVDSYKQTPVHQLLLNRWYNFRALFYYNGLTFSGFKDFLDMLRAQTFFSTLFAVGIYNIGWLFFLKPLSKSETKRERTALSNMALTVVLSLLFWVLLMFLPGSAVIHQGSYATMMLLFMVLASKLAKHLSAVWLVLILAFQLILMLAVWGYGLYSSPGYYLSGPVGFLAYAAALLMLIWAAHGIIKGSDKLPG